MIVLNVKNNYTDNNYWTPLADQVEESEEAINTITLTDNKENAIPPSYRLPFGGTTTSKERHSERRLERLKDKKTLKERIANGQEPSGILDTGATSSFVTDNDTRHLMPTGQKSNKTVKMPNGTKVAAGKKYILKNGLRQPANTADSIPTLKTTLVSNSKLADAGYTSVFDKDEVNVYDNNTTEIKITGAAAMTGFRDKTTGLWRVPLKSNPTNLNTDTRLLSRQESNSIVEEIAANVHDLPSTEKVIRYLHAAAGFPTKPTWIKAITSGFYSTWPLLTVKNVNKHFPESEETQKGHMRQKRSGVQKPTVKYDL